MGIVKRSLVSIIISSIACVSIILFLTGFAMAEGPRKGLLEGTPVEVSADTAIYSKYIWRGFKLDGDPVMQTGIYLSGYGIELSGWGSSDIDSDDNLNSEEIDYAAGYTYTFNNIPLSLSGGLTYYDFPGTDGSSREFYVGCSVDTILSPALTWYHDFGDEDSGGGSGDYVVLGLDHSIPLGKLPVTLDLSGHAGYNDELFINGSGGDVGLGAGLTIQLTEKCSLSPSINYSIPFGDLEDSSDGNQDRQFYGGAVLAFSF